MKFKRNLLLAFFSLLSIFGAATCRAQAASGLEKAKKEIAATDAIFYNSFAKNDSTIFLNCYADDACMIPQNSPLICGKADLAKYFRAGYNAGVRDGKLYTTAIYGDGLNYVTEEGIAKIFDKDGKQIDEVNYLVLWKKTSHGWKMFRDMFSRDKSRK